MIGKCKHGEFNLMEGCHQCIAEGRTAKLAAQVKEKLEGEEVVVAENTVTTTPALIAETETSLALRPGEDITTHGYYEESQRLLEYAEKRVIASLEDNAAATDDLVNISYIKKAMMGKKKEYLDPILSQAEEIRQTYNHLMVPIFGAEKITKDKMLAYDAEQRRIRSAQEEINRKRLEAAQEEMKLTGELSQSVNLVEVQPEISKRVSTELGTSGITKIWKFQVIDFSLLPDRFKMENATLIGKVVRAGEREIPGVKIWSEDTLRVTAR